ncbi:MAG: hypothetical protein H7346_22120 [Burkholderiaceae bacterium]|nr:hypothetical protein [Burkholderiaceae bacterium]
MLTLRRHRVLTVLVALVSLLFMQLAVAGYACPGLASSAGAMPHASMPCPLGMKMSADAGMDDQQPALCHAHCHGGKQMSDGHHALLPDAAAGHAVAYLIVPPAAMPLSEAPQAPLLARAAAPPLSILHCCFRI